MLLNPAMMRRGPKMEKPVLIAATGNPNKIREIKEILRDAFHVISMKDAGITEEAEENGRTFEENALIKARFVSTRTGQAAIADDSGLEVDALGGAPGVYSARYAGMHGDDEANNRLLLSNLKDIEPPRTGRYVCAIALVRPGKPDLCCRGTCEGEILQEYRGTGGFGYDPLFLCETGETFAEISMESKNKISHRKRAIEGLLRLLKNEAEAKPKA